MCLSAFEGYLGFWDSTKQSLTNHQDVQKKKITCPTNSYTKITCPKNSHTKIYPKNSHTKNHIVHKCPKNPHDQNHNQKFSMIKITIENFPCLKSQSQKFPWSYVTHLTKIFHSPKSHTHKIFPCSQNFSIPTKFCHVHEIKFTHANKISRIYHECIHPNPHDKFFTISMPPKSKPKFIQQHHKLPTLPKFMSHQHCPSYTMTKKYNNSKMLQNQDYNIINHTMPQIPTRAHNKMTISQHQTFNEAWKMFHNIFPNKQTKKNSLWSPCGNVEHGSSGLEGAPPHHSIQVMDDISFHEK